MKKSILFVLHEGNIGGATKSAIELIKKLSTVYTLYIIIPSKSGGTYTKLKSVNNITILSFPYFWWRSNHHLSKFKQVRNHLLYSFNNLSLIYFMLKLRRIKIDIVHSNSSVIDLGAKIAQKKNITHIWHLREFGVLDQNLYFIKSNKKSYSFMNESTSFFICISDSIKKYYSQFLPSNKLITIYNGVDTQFHYYKDYSFQSDIVHFIICSALQEGKGHIDALNGFKDVMDKGYFQYHFTIVGKDINGYKERLVSLVNQYGLVDYVTFIDFTEDIFTLRKKQDIELVCSTKEAFGRVTVESMLCSNPVIASNTGANPEIVKDNCNGFLYDKNDLNTLSNIIINILDKKVDIKSMRKNAYTYAMYNFSIDRCCHQIMELYERI